MTTYLLFLGLFAFVFVASSAKDSSALKKAIAAKAARFKWPHKAITILIVTSQVSELVKIVEHVSVMHVAVSIFLLTIIMAAKAGTENELY